MSNDFQKRFDEESLQSEKLRIIILTTLFSCSIIYLSISILFFNDTIQSFLGQKSLYTVFFLQIILTAFEGISLLYVIKRIRRNKRHVPTILQYINSIVEITFPMIMMYFISDQFDHPSQVLHSPIASTYFIFIILSTLRLNFRLSVFMGLLAAIEYVLLSYYLLEPATSLISSSFIDSHFVHFAKALSFLMSGVASGFVSRQIRSSIERTLTEAEQKTQVVNLFRQQISSTVVDNMLEKNGSLESKRMNVSVMFIDIRDFTKYVADKSPEEIVNYQNSFFQIIIECVTRHNGIINQFLGDGCMVTFGAPASLENPGQNAVEAALEIKNRIALAVENQKLPPTKIGVGIHTGEAVTGNIGNETRQQYSITGGVVILAARIEQLNKEYQSQILISEEVMKSTENGIIQKSVHLGKIALKGWDQPVGIYKLA